MALRAEHELHRRRFSRNVGLGLTLAAFVALVFALTLVKIARGEDQAMQPAAQLGGQQDPAEAPDRATGAGTAGQPGTQPGARIP